MFLASKSKKNKKKKAKSKSNGDNAHAGDTKQAPDQENEGPEEEHDPDSPVDEHEAHDTATESSTVPAAELATPAVLPLTEDPKEQNGDSTNGEYAAQNEDTPLQSAEPAKATTDTPNTAFTDSTATASELAINSSSIAHTVPDIESNTSNNTAEPHNLSRETEERLAAAAKERDDLRLEVTELRKSLESIQQQHEEQLASFRTQVEEAESGKEHAETQYKTLLGKVNTIRAQLGERLKADAVCACLQFKKAEDSANADSRRTWLKHEHR